MNMHLYWVGVAADLWRAGDRSLEWILRGAVNGEVFAAGHAERGNDVPLFQSTTKAERVTGGYRFTGHKSFGSLTPVWTYLGLHALDASDPAAPKVVHGKSRPQITAFIVDASSAGVETLHRCDFMGLRGIQNGIIRFTDVKVPAGNVLWGEGLGLKLALRTLNTGRLTLPAACTGMGKQCLSIARRWVSSTAAMEAASSGVISAFDSAATTAACAWTRPSEVSTGGRSSSTGRPRRFGQVRDSMSQAARMSPLRAARSTTRMISAVPWAPSFCQGLSLRRMCGARECDSTDWFRKHGIKLARSGHLLSPAPGPAHRAFEAIP